MLGLQCEKKEQPNKAAESSSSSSSSTQQQHSSSRAANQQQHTAATATEQQSISFLFCYFCAIVPESHTTSKIMFYCIVCFISVFFGITITTVRPVDRGCWKSGFPVLPCSSFRAGRKGYPKRKRCGQKNIIVWFA